MVIVAAVTVAVTATGCQAGSTGTETHQSSPSQHSPAESLAVLDTGAATPAEVQSWQSRLSLLETYCAGDDRRISDNIVVARETLRKTYHKDLSYRAVAEGITNVASSAAALHPPGTGQDCDAVAAQYMASAASGQ